MRGSIGSMWLRSDHGRSGARRTTWAIARRHVRGATVPVRRLPLAQASCRADIIVGFNGQPVTEQSQFARLIADAPVGSVAKLEVMRAGQAP